MLMKFHAPTLRSLRGPIAASVCLAGVALVVLASSSSTATAQVKQGRFITETAARLQKLVDAANADGYKLQANSFSIGGGWLKQSEKEWISIVNVKLTAGKEYRFLAAGDADATDVDLRIVDPKNSDTIFASDAGTDPEAVVNYKPAKTGSYQVQIRLYNSKGNAPCVCLALVMSK
jgi:hypothetical protein